MGLGTFSQKGTEGTEGLAHWDLRCKFSILGFGDVKERAEASSVFSVCSCEILDLQIFAQEVREGTEGLAHWAQLKSMSDSLPSVSRLL